jgi:hypothetical protein
VLLFPLAIAKRMSERFLPASPNDLTVPPAPVNIAFEAAVRLEEPLSRFIKLPAGLSAVAVGRG